jgi:gliding motility-associated-like protein
LRFILKDTAMKINAFVLLLILCFATQINAQQINPTPFGFNTPLAQNPKDTAAPIVWTEVIEERSIFSSSFKSEDGQVKIEYSKVPINYFNANKQLVPINPTLREISKYAAVWAALDQPFPTWLYDNGAFRITVGENNSMRVGDQLMLNGTVMKGSRVQRTNNRAVQHFDGTGISRILDFFENAVEYSYVLSEMSTSSTDNFTFDEQLDLPKGCIASVEEGLLLIRNAENQVVSTFHAPLCYDAQKNWTLGEYAVIEKDNKTYARLSVSATWLNAADRQYPVVIDPIVQGPTSVWNGGAMPSCILPNYNIDSIQVVIPAGVTVTGLFITGSFYADPFTTAIMSQGEMKYSTTCGISQAFTITGATASLPGTAYLDSFNILSPLMCCFPESCNPQSFYLRMHLGRTGPGAGCNTTYIRYDPITTLWPFKAVVLGRTPEPYGSKWNVPAVPICSNQCTITGTAYVNYGVAPYTYTHPWSTQTVTQGQNNGCGTGANSFQFTLNIPNCPTYCDTTSTLVVPPPIITDACGTVVMGIPSDAVPLKITPQVEVIMDTLLCSGAQSTIVLNSCVPNGVVNWSGNGQSGTGTFVDTIYNTTNSVATIPFTAVTSENGCVSDTVYLNLYVEPLPTANFSSTPNPAIVAVPVDFTNQSQNYDGPLSYTWILDGQNFSVDQNTVNTFFNPGEYTMCLAAESNTLCADTVCQLIQVVPATVIPPNVITANNDQVNDLLEFKYLEFYPNNSLVILNRWGNVVFEKVGYANDWNGDNLNAGTYFYTLIVNDGEQEYKGFIQIVR